MSRRPYKFLVVAVVQRLDDEGNTVGEDETEPAVVFSVDGLVEWAQAFPDNLARADASTDA